MKKGIILTLLTISVLSNSYEVKADFYDIWKASSDILQQAIISCTQSSAPIPAQCSVSFYTEMVNGVAVPSWLLTRCAPDYCGPWVKGDFPTMYDSIPSESKPDMCTPLPKTRGSDISQIDRAVGEEISILGAPFSLRYDSNRGHRLNEYQIAVRTCDTHNSTGSLPDCRIKIEVEGKVFQDEFIGAPNQVFSINWQGTNSIGNKITLPTEADVTFEFLNQPDQIPPYTFKYKTGVFDEGLMGLGGWMISIQHFFDISNNIIYYGDGNQELVKPYQDSQGYTVVSGNRDEVYYFDLNGKHINTRTRFLGKNKYNFYYTNGYLTSISDSDGNTYSFIRQNNNLSSIVTIAGETQIGLNSYGLISQVIDPANATTNIGYHNSRGLIANFSPPQTLMTSYVYDSLGNLSSFQKPNGKVVTYSRTDNIIQEIFNGTILNSYNYGGSSKSLTGADGYYRNSTQDISQIFISDGFGSKSKSIIEGQRFTNDKFINQENRQNGPISQQWNYTESYTYSNASDPFSVQTYTKTSTLNNLSWVDSYDASTQKMTRTTPLGRSSYYKLDSKERVSEVGMPGVLATSINFQSNGKLASVTQGARSQTYSYNAQGFLASVTNALNEATQYSYDGHGRVTSMTLPDSRQVSFSYDGRGNMTSITPPSRPAIIFDITSFDATEAIKPPLISGMTQSNTTYQYDNFDRVTQMTRPSGATIQYDYDVNRGTLSSITDPVSTKQVYIDSNGNLSSISDSQIFQQISYNGSFLSFDSVSRYNQSTGQNDFGVVEYAYNSNGSPTQILLRNQANNSSTSISYTYDNDMKLKTLGAETLNYNAQNGLLTEVLNGNFKGTYTYNSYGEVETYTAKYGTNTLYSYTLSYNNAGRIIGKTETIQGVTNTYGYDYDSTGRLISVILNGTASSSYSYDANSNKTSGTIAGTSFTGAYDNQDRIQTWNGTNLTHNDNGELIQSTTGSQNTFYTYDVYGNLKQVQLPTQTVSYTLDHLGRRIERKLGTSVTNKYMYDGSWRIIGEQNPNNTIKRQYVYGSRSHVPDYYRQSGVNYQYITDHLGSVRLVIKVSDGSVQQRLDYNEWGKIVSSVNPTTQPFGFAGGLYDPNTGLYKFGARTYDPNMGRWLTKDPIWYKGGDTNLFGYVNSNPVMFVDPNGKFAQFILAPIIGAAVGGTTSFITTYGSSKNFENALDALFTGAAGGAVGSLVMFTPLGSIGAVAAGTGFSLLTSLGDSEANPHDVGGGLKHLVKDKMGLCK